MAGLNIPYEEKRFMMEFLNLWNEYGRPPITIHTDNLISTDKGSGSIKGLQHKFVEEVLDVADYLNVNVQLDCLGVRGSSGNTPLSVVMEAEGEEKGDDKGGADDSADTPTDYAETDDGEDAPTDYAEEDDGEEPVDDDEQESSEENQEEGQDEEQNTDETTDGDVITPEEDNPTDYSEEAGEGDDMGGDSSGDNDTESEETPSDEQTDSSNINILVKNFSLMGDFENLYSLITDSINTLNSTLKADPGQNRVLVQVSRNLTIIKDFILTFVQFHFKNDNYQHNLYYYEVIVHLLKLNLAMLEKALSIGSSRKENKVRR